MFTPCSNTCTDYAHVWLLPGYEHEASNLGLFAGYFYYSAQELAHKGHSKFSDKVN
jgi:hypothetical protein